MQPAIYIVCNFRGFRGHVTSVKSIQQTCISLVLIVPCFLLFGTLFV